MRIWKYQLELTDLQSLDMPEGAMLMSVDNQRGSLCLWAMADSDSPARSKRTIEIIGTGNPIPFAERSFVGTVVIDPFVWHVFERH